MKENRITEGKLLPAFILFMLPLIASSCLMQTYSIADGLILGNAISQEALGSVSSCSSVLDVCTLIQIALAGGCSIMVSHLYGSEKYTEAAGLVREIWRLVVIISILIAASAFAFTPVILRLLHTPESLFAGASTYMRICFAGVPFMSLYSLQSGILRGMGDSKRPLGGIAVSSAVNIGLDLVFVVLLHMDIAGAAIATVSSEALSAAYLYIKLREKLDAALASGSISADASAAGRRSSYTRECISLSVPQIVQSLVTSGGNVLLQNITNILGAAVVIGVTVAFKIDSLLIIPMISIGISVSVFTGQNIGAGRPARVRQSLKYGLLFAVGLAAVMTMVLWLWGYPMFRLFGLGDEAAATGFRYIEVCLPFYWLFGLQFVLNGYLNGAKHTVVTSSASIAGLAGRLLLAYLGYIRFGADVLPMAEALSWAVCVLIDTAAILYFRSAPKA
jgi:putative MATE family efflux protein